MPCGVLVTFGDDTSASKQSLTGTCPAARKPPPVDRRSGADRICERVQEIGLEDTLDALTCTRERGATSATGWGVLRHRTRTTHRCSQKPVGMPPGSAGSAPLARPHHGTAYPAPSEGRLGWGPPALRRPTGGTPLFPPRVGNVDLHINGSHASQTSQPAPSGSGNRHYPMHLDDLVMPRSNRYHPQTRADQFAQPRDIGTRFGRKLRKIAHARC